jgi:hypothetical protein
MAKLKEVRALKSSGVEPLAPTLIKRILHNLVLKAEDRRWASEIGRLSMLGELTARQTSAAYHVGEIYGRFEWLHGRRRRQDCGRLPHLSGAQLPRSRDGAAHVDRERDLVLERGGPQGTRLPRA